MNKKIKLHLACGKDELRPVMGYIKVTKSVCVATNAHILAVIPTEDIFNQDFISGIPEDGVLLHSEDYKKMLMFEIATWKKEGEVIKMIDSKKRPQLFEVETEGEVGKYPNWQSIIPYNPNIELNYIGLNMNLAKDLQDALGLESCKMEFDGESRPITLTDAKGEHKGRYGIVMPVMTNS